MDIYSEYEPCEARCQNRVKGMNTTWSWSWNPPEVRDASRAAKAVAVGGLFK